MAIPISITNAWQRWTHRSDLTADLVLIEALARERILNRLMVSIDDIPDPDVLATTNPSIWLYAGNAEIHVLAQDEAELTKALDLFENGIAAYLMKRSIDQGLPTAVKTDYKS